MAIEEQLMVTSEHYKGFLESAIWQDLLQLFRETLETNRDLLEGIVGFRPGVEPEPMDAIRGRNWQIRDIIAYVNERATSTESEGD